MKQTVLKKGKNSLKVRKYLKRKTTIRRVVKKSVVTKIKVKDINHLKKEVDHWFSKYIRYRDGRLEGGEWVADCITCGRTYPYKTIQAGHFISRQHNITRFHEKNVHAQCYGCNVAANGRQYEHSLAIDKKYGKGTAKKIHELASQTHTFKRDELLKLILLYKGKVSDYEKNTLTHT